MNLKRNFRQKIKETSPVESSTGYSQQVFFFSFIYFYFVIIFEDGKGRARGDAVTPDNTINNPEREEEEAQKEKIPPTSYTHTDKTQQPKKKK